MPLEHKYIYLLVSEDEYEFPLDFDVSCYALARRHDVHPSVIMTGARLTERKERRSKWRRVKI